MTIPLYSSRTLPLYPDLATPLHRIPTSADLLLLHVTWQHLTYGPLGFSAPRLRPTAARLRFPDDSLIALSTRTATTDPEVVFTPSPFYNGITTRTQYFRWDLTLFHPELGEPRSRWGRLLPAGGGFLYAHALERTRSKVYGRNADSEWLNHGLLVIAHHHAATDDPWPNTLFPRLDLPPFQYLLDPNPPFPSQAEVVEAMTDARPLLTGDYTIEVEHPAVDYNIGYHDFGRGMVPQFGVADLTLDLHALDNAPLARITDPTLPNLFHHKLAEGHGEGHIPANDWSTIRTLTFEE